ncbi:MAG: peptidase S41, partial [Lutibacter sp.]|nr:peptidase S41 [Lutibacter sp.]
MKKISYISSITFLFVSLFVGCIKSDDKPSSTSNLDFSNVEIQDFIWEGMNTYYLWKDNVPNLANTANDNDQYYLDLLNSKSGPEEFFESLIYNRSTVDEWSWIVDNYVALENSFQGISTSNGVEYRLSYETGSDTKLLGYVRYIQPNSNASSKNIKRGDVFNAVNGVGLTINNYESLLSANSYTLNMADLNNGNPISNGKTVSLIQSEYQENPVYIAKTVTVEGERIGYLMYNSFTSTYDQQLNTAFAQLKSEGATELVLDLRYNSGGSVQTAVYLASMITGQFNGQLFAKEKWNAEVQSWFDANNPDWIVNNFVNKITNDDNSEIAINSLNLTKLYV